MRKYIFFLLFIFPTLIFSARLNESFTSTTFPPMGWRVINNDGGSQLWRRDTAICKTQPASAASRFETSVRSDDWLITSALIVNQNDSLSFWYRRRFGNYDTLRVKVSLTTNHPDSFNFLLLEKRVTNETFSQEKIALNNFVNDTIFIAFIHNAPPNQGTLYLDDIVGPEMVEIRDVGVDSILMPNFCFIRPVGIGLQPKAKITNFSNEIQKNIPVSCSIIGNSSGLLYIDIKYLDSLLIDSSAIITFDSFVPVIAESCSVKVNTFLDNDINLNNNRKVSRIELIRGQYTGGPDANYYFWIDSDTIGGPIFNWHDIFYTGEPLPTGSANISWPIPIGFDFYYYGQPKFWFCYSTNGFISFEQLSLSYANNQPIPASDLPNSIIAPFWDKLFVYNGRHQLFGAAPNRYKVIQWNAVCNPAGSYMDTVIFQVILYENGDIVFQYQRCDKRFGFGQGESATVGIEDDYGTSGLQYLNNSSPIGNLLSAGRAIKFYRSCHDVMVDTILTSQVGIGETISPTVVIKNIGSEVESVLTVVNILDEHSLIYSDSAMIFNFLPLNSCTLSFSDWIANNYGIYTIKAWTINENDMNPDNDTCEQTLEVSIPAPILLSPLNNFVTNRDSITFNWSEITNAIQYQIEVKRGSLVEIDTIITDTELGPLHFSEGSYSWRVRAGTLTRWGFWSESFSFTIDTTPPLAPILISPAQNCTLSTSIFIWQKVNDAANYQIVISKDQNIIINQMTADTTFEPSQFLENGWYFWKVRCQDFAGNWSLFSPIQSFYIYTVLWQQKDTMPSLFSYRPVKDGGCITALGNKLYALKGNNTQDFYEYDINTNQWVNRSLFPFYTENSNIIKRKVKAGADLVSANNMIFAIKGNNTREFWAYYPNSDSWAHKRFIPSVKGLKAGSNLTFYNGNIYCLVGGGYEFYRYDIAKDSWYGLCSAPAGRNNRKFRFGSSIAYGGNGRIYALKGMSTYNEFYYYDINTNSWEEQESLPYFHPLIRKKRTVKAGGGICYDGAQKIYAIKGGGENEFWQYDILTNHWQALETIPKLHKRSVVKNGADITYADNRVWLLKGNKTKELWAYQTFSTNPKTSDNQTGYLTNNSKITMTPNNGDIKYKLVYYRESDKQAVIKNILKNNKNIKVFDIQGRLISNIADLRNGVYYIIKY
ncbi:MAG: choice-of-anchor J domain-containing protein [candidate division WOR-3 bacterium]